MARKHKGEYRDGFFRDLLGLDEGANERFIDVVNATFGLDLEDNAEIKDVSLDNVLYTSLRNDIAKVVNGTLIVLVEHQSTINENMPLRMLEYVAETYQNLLNAQDRYKTLLQKIPCPLFAVFYNGRADFPQEKVLHLSDAFNTDALGAPESQSWKSAWHKMLELEVPVINIRLNKESKILKRSQTLHDYATLCSNIEESRQQGESDYVRLGILRTIDSGVLVEYLKRNIQEVAGMLKAEYDYDTDIAVKSRESYELGISQGVRATARAMFSERLPIATIVRCTGLTYDEAAAVAKENGFNTAFCGRT